MVRITASVLAFAVTAMTATVSVRSSGDVSTGSADKFHARAVSGMHVERREQDDESADQIPKLMDELEKSLNSTQIGISKKIDELMEKELTDSGASQPDDGPQPNGTAADSAAK
ncbi:hypothetical protein HRG_000369 [Hirsutella rhossiliensis]|uniref:RxLR effector protein n=1 Tax=Hirsutella rhossiliensis TaxID=111463 RepID=A0A9P8N679_9HYPO|nr:uncharacterized protein HRG_00369 [Hirsutella rhossiliensis]KAH0967727.1 hypothetical protein HRG_00369 [Hirsutella rhossiliensis]